VRLRSSASAYFNRTPATTTNQKTWTWSGWVKLGAIGQWEGIFNAGSSGNQFAMYLYTDSTLYIQDYTGANNLLLQTNQLFRDPSAWYHIVLAVDTTQATSSNRAKLYINGVQVTSFASTTYPSQNYNTQVNSNSYQHDLGLNYQFGTSNAKYYDGYLTEINFIDGQALTPSSFGSTNAITGVWQPAKYTGTYGTNGFYLNFSDNSSVTTSSNVGIGKDFSGNGNYWTSNTINVTAYSGSPPNNVNYDSMTDVPTLTSATAANYCVSNPLDKNTNLSVTSGNLQSTGTAAQYQAIRGTFGVSSGKWYFEATITANNFASNGVNVGVGQITAPFTAGPGAASNAWMYANNNGSGAGRKIDGANVTTYGASFTTNDVIGVALDLGAGSLEFYKNGTSQGVAYSSGVTGELFPFVSMYSTDAIALNCGQRPFSYTPPTGYVALNTYNLPASTAPIPNGAKHMAVTLYTGNGTSQTIVNTASGASFQPDLIWTKSRSGAGNHSWVDSVRGTSLQLSSTQTLSEVTDATEITAITSTGFSVGNSTGAGYSTNGSTVTYVGWQWKGGGTAVLNTDGSVTSSVSANTTAGFSIVGFTGVPTGGTTATIGHGLGVAPNFIIIKNRDFSDDWYCYHSSLGNNAYIILDAVSGQATPTNLWVTTSPSPTVFTLRGGNLNTTTLQKLIAYCFSAVKGYSAFGSYTGNGVTDGPFVYTGFRPRFIMAKAAIGTTGDWQIFDTSRNTYNVMDLRLDADGTTSESAFGSVPTFDALSNGFKLRSASGSINGSTNTFIYMAFAENPFKNSLAR
jgi:hypothetical protein